MNRVLSGSLASSGLLVSSMALRLLLSLGLLVSLVPLVCLLGRRSDIINYLALQKSSRIFYYLDLQHRCCARSRKKNENENERCPSSKSRHILRVIAPCFSNHYVLFFGSQITLVSMDKDAYRRSNYIGQHP